MGVIAEECSFAEKIAFAENSDELRFRIRWRYFQGFDFTFINDAKGARQFALAVNVIAGEKVGVSYVQSGIGVEKAEIAWEEDVPGPVEGDFESAGPRRQFKEVDAAPHKPCEETRESHAKHFGNSGVAADGTELAKGFEAEGFGGLAAQKADQIESGLAALALGELACGWGGLFVEVVDDERTIPEGPGVGLAFDAHFGRGADAALFFGDIEVLNEGRGGGADGANDGGSLELAAIFEFDSLVGGGDGTSFQENGDAGLFHFLSGKFAEGGSDFRQDLVLGMDHGHDDIFFAEVAVEAGAAANEFVEFAGNFNATETGAHDDEMEIRAATLGIAGGFGLFHLTDDVLAEVDGVAHDLEGESVLGHAGDDAEVAVRATSDGQVIVVQTRQDPVPIVILNLGSSQIDPLDALGAATYAGKHLAERSGGGVDIDGSSRDIREQGMKNHVVLAVEEENFTVRRAQLAAKSFCKFYGGKPSTDDDYSDWFHFFAPIALSTRYLGLELGGNGDDDLPVSAFVADCSTVRGRSLVQRNGGFDECSKMSRVKLPGDFD